MESPETIDWSECPLLEIKAGVQSGAPVLRGTRMPVNCHCLITSIMVSVPLKSPNSLRSRWNRWKRS
jgi:hypothetical protein